MSAGRARGHEISESAFLRGRPQRALRRTRLYRGLSVDWEADIFMLENVRNCPELGLPFPPAILERALATGRAVAVEDAWVDTCVLDMPCGGDPAACPPACRREWANDFYGRCLMAIFLSPMQLRMVESVVDRLPAHRIVRPPYVDVERFRPLGLERDIDVLYVGSINEAKGYRNLLARFGPDRLTLVGRNGLGEPVQGTYLGEASYDDVPELYNRAKVFAHLPEWHEPMGRAVMEAALCGCELVVNDRVGIASFPREEWTDPAVVARALDRFWTEFEAAVEALN
jgi:glycosyltransferase involved in cell wall biosynthesis